MTSQDFKQLYKGLKLGVLSSEKDGDDGHDHEKHKRRRKRREIVSVAVESDTELDKVKIFLISKELRAHA